METTYETILAGLADRPDPASQLVADLERSLTLLYGEARLPGALERCQTVIRGFRETYGSAPEQLFSAPGRTELGGNHTDHQHGKVLAAAIDLDILAAVSRNHSGCIRIQSQGYPIITVDLRDLTPHPEEANTSAALVRGVAARFAALGCPLQNLGVDAFMISDVPGGSGLSSSAAFEVLIGTILNDLFWESRCSAIEIAQIGQYAENVFFGKPCGLMDQTASAAGGVVFIDFQDTDHPAVENLSLDLGGNGYALCILDSGADHADLTGEYAAITGELSAVCACFGKTVLREIPESDFMKQLPAVRSACGDRAVLRALHVYAENQRAAEEADALRTGTFSRFLQLSAASGRSSALYLQNVVPRGQAKQQALLLTLALSEKFLAGRGAVRVHGGGFGGTAQAFVPLDLVGEFRTAMESVLGAGSCHVVNIRPVGGCRLL